MNEEILNKLLIVRTPGIGPMKYRTLIEIYGSDAAVVDALNLSDDFIDSVKREIEAAEKLNVQFIVDTDSLYPELLRAIKNHPIVLSVRGNIETLKQKTVSIVGTRHATAAGMGFVSHLAHEFARHKYTVVSGMAMGTDYAAHIGALKADGNTQTIAVLAGGVDSIWPFENESLYYEIIERGAIISEMPIGTKPIASYFVQRNQWIAGLSDSLIISEADLKSGSMTTARFAKDYQRRIFAVPGHPSDARSAGPNSLIKSGDATLCMSVSDFFDDETVSVEKKSKEKNVILDKLGTIPVSESVLANLVQKNISEIKAELVMLEIQGLVRKQNGGYVLN